MKDSIFIELTKKTHHGRIYSVGFEMLGISPVKDPMKGMEMGQSIVSDREIAIDKYDKAMKLLET